MLYVERLNYKFIVCANDQTISVYHYNNGSKVHDIALADPYLFAMVHLNDTNLIITGNAERKIQVFNILNANLQ